MSALLDADGFRFGCYVVASLTALAAFASEHRQRRRTSNRTLWPPFWLLQAALLAAMGLAMAADAADALTDLARERARAESWYLDRRSLQVPIVAAIAAVWIASNVLAIWRVPPRRRRYLPPTALIGSVITFAAIRTVSLHHIDTLLYRRDLLGVRIVSVVEIALLVVVTMVTVAAIRPIDRAHVDVSPSGVAAPLRLNDDGFRATARTKPVER